jgi:hypothetical protein
MCSIFGISDLPVATITTAVQIGGGMDVPAPADTTSKSKLERIPDTDKFISKQNKSHISNPVIKMRNGFGKLLKHFSKVQIK